MNSLLEEIELTPHSTSPADFAVWASGGKWKKFRHIEFIARIITTAILVGDQRIILNMQPRIGKSEFVSHWVPAWYLEHFPDHFIACCSYEKGLAHDFGRKVKGEFDSNPFLTQKLRHDSKAAGRWHTTEGGGMWATGIGGSAVGRGFHIGIVDDPHKNWQEAFSSLKRKRVKEWFDSTFYSRMEPGASIIVVMQRWHEDDLSGFLLKERASDGWKVITLPSIAEKNDPMGRAEGEAVCPERFPIEDILRKQRVMPKIMFMPMFQQKPIGLGTGRVYYAFDEALNTTDEIELREDLPLQLSWDFNVNPGTHCIIGQHDPVSDTLVAVDEIFEERADARRGVKLFAKWLEQCPKKFPEVQIFGDSSGNNRNLVTSESCYDMIARVLSEKGIPYRIRVPAGAPSIRDSVDAVNFAFIGPDDDHPTPHYFVHKTRCPRLIHDYKNVVMDDKQGIEKSNQDLTHPSDAERYRIHYLRPIVVEYGDRDTHVGV